MFRIFDNKTREERLCEKYSKLMERSYKIALRDKERSDQLHNKAVKILNELKRMKCSLVD